MIQHAKQTSHTAETLRVVSDATAAFEAEFDATERAVLRRDTDGEGAPPVYAADEREQAMQDFEVLAVADALNTLADNIQSAIDVRMEKAYQQALDVYYAAEELARSPEHAAVLVQVEAMRRAHEATYGRPIPPKP